MDLGHLASWVRKGLAVIADAAGVTLDELGSASRSGRVVAARRAAARWLAFRGFSQPEIARALGRDRSTVFRLLACECGAPMATGARGAERGRACVSCGLAYFGGIPWARMPDEDLPW